MSLVGDLIICILFLGLARFAIPLALTTKTGADLQERITIEFSKWAGELKIYCLLLGYLKDSNAAAHSVDSDIFYAGIYLSVRSKTCRDV